MKVLAVVPGPETHGVVRHALSVARAVGADVQRDLSAPVSRYDVVHVPFTDRLFGSDIASAAAHFEAWVATTDAPVVVTLHDVPGSDGDPARDERRRAGYARVAASAAAVVVCSADEADRLTPRPTVVPLPVEHLAAPGPAPAWSGRTTLGVLGFVYPGKGHDRVLLAAAGTGAAVVAIGAASPGHEDLLEALRARAADLQVPLLVTGSLSDADLHAAARAVTVPVAAHTTPGASASLATWTAAGRRPVTTRSAQAAELERRDPGALLITADLGAGIGKALADPTSTWSAAAPARPDIAAAHLRVFRAVLR